MHVILTLLALSFMSCPSPCTTTQGGEYGRMPIKCELDSQLYKGEPSDTQLVWMSHGDEAVKLPSGFSVTARSEQVCMKSGCMHVWVCCTQGGE